MTKQYWTTKALALIKSMGGARTHQIYLLLEDEDEFKDYVTARTQIAQMVKRGMIYAEKIPCECCHTPSNIYHLTELGLLRLKERTD